MIKNGDFVHGNSADFSSFSGRVLEVNYEMKNAFIVIGKDESKILYLAKFSELGIIKKG